MILTDYPPPGGQIFYRYFSDLSQKYQISSFPYSKSYSIDRKHISDTPRHSRRVQNTILISKTYFGDENRIFGFLQISYRLTPPLGSCFQCVVYKGHKRKQLFMSSYQHFWQHFITRNQFTMRQHSNHLQCFKIWS